ncbi:hypothetical protein PtrV1_04350 [Pyrenophora tritici-repentis]|uniref:Uncharacterized protein n=1 Tax=Pyrenophora tritici-repentis TaxID=45151 RepID=A0A5M9LHS9_9PLEO|nr:hypothetical protein PtrV1_04350 [Pyrenophora tritici-repentis]KAF7452035.1 hypothetical protein A1F99_038120 [Pyrenophora tritici-repentis]KAF7574846.1 hypothetical protein PtrM4_064700 [Pyrenophora tritici-repentis]
MGVQKRTRKFAVTKKIIGQRDARLYATMRPATPPLHMR